MTLNLSQDTYSQALVAQQAQIQALQSKVQELEAKIQVLEQQSHLFI
jgi:polyhydroxyalkanoate synthesis regulator phasin